MFLCHAARIVALRGFAFEKAALGSSILGVPQIQGCMDTASTAFALEYLFSSELCIPIWAVPQV